VAPTPTIPPEMELVKPVPIVKLVMPPMETVSPAMPGLKSMELIVRPVPLILTIPQEIALAWIVQAA